MVEVDPAEISDGELRSNVTVYFTEVIPSSCKDMPNYEKRESRFRIAIKKGAAIGVLEYSLSDPRQWDLLDRNSAADGT